MEIDDRHGTSDLDIQHAKWPLPQSVSKHGRRQAERQSLLWLDSGSLCVWVCVFASVRVGWTVTKTFQRGGGTTLAEGFSTAMLEDFNRIFYFTGMQRLCAQ